MPRYRCHYIPPVDGAPPASFPTHPCIRIATNQIGEPGEIAEPGGPFSIGDTQSDVSWRGQTSGATGEMVGYGYNTLGTTPETFQQFIVMKDSSGTFIDDEVLLYSVNGGSFTDSGIRTRSAADGGVDQQDVDCDSGVGPLPPSQTPDDDISDPTVDPDPPCNSHGHLCPGTVDPPFSSDATFEMATASDYSAIAVTTPATVTGDRTGCRAMFVRWETGKIILSNIEINSTSRLFAPGETFTIEPATLAADAFRFANPNNLVEI